MVSITDKGVIDVSKIGGVTRLLHRIESIIEDKTAELSIVNPIDYIKIPRAVQIVTDYVVFNIKSEGIDKVRKKLLKDVYAMDIDLAEYFSFQYIVDSMLVSITFSPMEYDSDLFSKYYMIIHNILELINLIKFNTAKKLITGVDVKTNTIKYSNAQMKYDIFEGDMRCKEDCDLIMKLFGRVQEAFDSSLHGLDISTLPDTAAVMCVYDRLDDSLRQYRSSVIMADIANQMTGLHMPTPSLAACVSCLLMNTVIETKRDALLMRERTTPKSGVLLKAGETSCLFKEVIIGDYAYCVSSYNTEGTESTVIIPIDVSVMLQDMNAKAISMIYGYYGIENGCTHDVERLAPSMWRHRKSNYEGHEEDRHYFETEVEHHRRKAAHASDRAKQLAKEAHFNLPDGYTFVSDYVRRYNKDLLDK